MGFRTLFDQRSSEAASWRGACEAGEPIPPSGVAAIEDAKRPFYWKSGSRSWSSACDTSEKLSQVHARFFNLPFAVQTPTCSGAQIVACPLVWRLDKAASRFSTSVQSPVISASSITCCVGDAHAEPRTSHATSAVKFLVQIHVFIPLTSKSAFWGTDKAYR